MVEPLFINAMGLVSPLGKEPSAVLNRLISGDTSALELVSGLFSGRSTYVAPVKLALDALPQHLTAYQCRNNQLLLSAYRQIEPQIEALKSSYAAERMGVILGSSTAGILEGEQALSYKAKQGAYPEGFSYLQQELGSVAEFVAELAGAQGPVYTISTACSSSGKAFVSAARLIRAGVCDVVIVGGADSLCQLTVNGFDALESVSAKPCAPFSAHRCGINIGEGAALFVLSKVPAEVALLGSGESSDAYHISAPEPEGNGAERAIKMALDEAGLTPQQIGYVNLHGTATPKNDQMESTVIHRVFGEQLPCSSTKALTGHTLGAAGALELAFSYLLLTRNPLALLPPQMGEGPVDPELAKIALVKAGETLAQPVCMSNNFAFGGSNVSLIIGKIN